MLRNRTRIWTALCCSTSAIACLAWPSRASAQSTDIPGYQLVWQDEFNAGEDLTANWNLTQQDNYNGEKQYYLPQQDTLVNGNLRIVADKPATPVNGQPYVSGQLISLATYTQGRFEARIDLPSGKGMWPAFWLNANALTWPTGGEIDILEAGGSTPMSTSSAFHWQKDPSAPCCDQAGYQAAFNPNPSHVNYQAGFHTYAAEWDSTQIKYFVDGVQLLQVLYDPNKMSPANFNTPQNIRLNLAVGGNYDGDPDTSTTFPQFMDVDYVRVWKRIGLPGDYNNNGVVDAADYTVWRNHIGQTYALPNRSSQLTGPIGTGDYTFWKSQFGQHAGGAATDNPAIAAPEPSSTALFIAAVIATALLVSVRLLYARSP